MVLGLIFLKYISDAFEELHTKLKGGKGDYAGADPEDKDEYKAENVFFVPEIARWSFLQSKAKLPTIGKEVDNAMDAIEKEKMLATGRANSCAPMAAGNSARHRQATQTTLGFSTSCIT